MNPWVFERIVVRNTRILSLSGFGDEKCCISYNNP